MQQMLWVALGAVLLTATVLAWQIVGTSPYDEVGVASWYGPGFDGNTTANGEIFDMYAISAAHKTFPFGTILRVTDLETGKSVVVRVNDRGPFVKQRILDLSFGAARLLGLSGDTPQDTGRGITKVGLKVLVWGDNYYVKRP